MQRVELDRIAMSVRRVGDRIQPMLAPVPGLAARNAHAHIWLGIKVVFGEQWRTRASVGGVCAFIDWLEANPNAEYAAFPGPVELRAPEEGLFGPLDQ